MSLPDPVASAALSARVIKPVWFVFLDFQGDPARANSSGVNMSIAGTGIPDLDGEYIGIDPRLVSISSVKYSGGGSDAVTAKLSGLRGLDDDDRIMLADPANWQGRLVRMWRIIRDENNVQQGGFQHYYTGYMTALSHLGSANDLTIELTIESYLAAFSQASNRTYLDQEEFDPGDLSAAATLAIVNGTSASPLLGVAGGPSVNYTDSYRGPYGDQQDYWP